MISQPEAVTVHVRVVSDVPGELRLDLGHAYDGTPRPFTTPRFGTVGGRDRDAEGAAVQAAASTTSSRCACTTGTDSVL